MFEVVVFRLLWLGVSILLEGFDFSVFTVSVTILGPCWHVFLLICWCISITSFLYHRPSLVSKSCFKSNVIFPDFYYSFSIPKLYRVVPKITVKYKFVVYPSQFPKLESLIWVVAYYVVCYIIKEWFFYINHFSFIIFYQPFGSHSPGA